MKNLTLTYLGSNSYPAIVSEITEKLFECSPITGIGNELKNSLIQKLNESHTPIIEIKEFVTNAEKIAPQDTPLMDVIKFAREKSNNGDLNYFINLCKEEHIENNLKSNLPGVDETIQALDSLLMEPSSIIEQGIKNGLFKDLNSKLLNEVTANELGMDLDKSKNKIVSEPDFKKMNESLSWDSAFVSYNPIGITMEDVKNERLLLLTESVVIGMDRSNKTYNVLGIDELSDLNIPDTNKRLMSAISNLAYDPDKNIFSLNESWDFSMELNKDGVVLCQGKEISKPEVIKMLAESIQDYEINPGISPANFDRQKYIMDSDNFVMLMENHNKLVKIEDLVTLRSSDGSNNYAIVQNFTNYEKATPTLISNSGKPTQIFESWNALVGEVQNIFEGKNIYDSNIVGKLFESQLSVEQKMVNDKIGSEQKLIEEQNQLNSLILENNRLLGIAEEGSPAYEKLFESKKELTLKLDQNIESLTNNKNQKFY